MRQAHTASILGLALVGLMAAAVGAAMLRREPARHRPPTPGAPTVTTADAPLPDDRLDAILRNFALPHGTDPAEYAPPCLPAEVLALAREARASRDARRRAGEGGRP